MDKMFQPEIEAMPRDQIDTLQSSLLIELIQHVYDRIPFYRNALNEAGIDPKSFAGLEDLTKLPFTEKQDLRDNYPFGLFAVPRDEVVRVHASSGTTGQASVVGYTEKDIDTWGELVSRAFVAAGLDDQSTLQVAYGYGLFTGGLGAHVGGERLGCTVVPMSTGNTSRQIQILHDFEVDALACTPSYALVIAERARDMGYDLKKDFKLRSCILGAEPFSIRLRDAIEREFDCKAYDIYGLSEIMGPGVASECSCQNGLHVGEDVFIIEIIDPETLQPVPEGEWGEVVFTTIKKECSPVIRYRTRDISRIIPGECPCGRTHRRLDKPRGRSDDMLIIRGINVFPSQIESVLAHYPVVSPYYQLVLTTENYLDKVTLEVEVDSDFPFDEVRKLQELKRSIASDLKSNLQISIEVRIVEPRSIERVEGKAKRIIDRRNER